MISCSRSAMLLALTIALAACRASDARSFNFSCFQPTPQPNAPSLPNITDQFTATVIANIQTKGYTMTMKEYYDDVNNRGRLETTNPSGQTLTRIYTFTDKQWYQINGSDCTVHDLSPDSFLAFPATFDNQGNAHIRGVADILNFGRQYHDVYVGQDTVRGMGVDHWKACQTDDFGQETMSMDWYFTVNEDGTSSYRYGTPVRLVIEGIAGGQDDDQGDDDYDGDADGDDDDDGFDGDDDASTTHYFKHIYDFSSFTSGPPDSRLFQIPHNIHCHGSQKKLPTVPNEYSVGMQMIDPDMGVVQHGVEYASYNTKRLVDHSGAFSEINDFRLGVSFLVTPDNCTATELTPASGIMGFMGSAPATVTADHQRLKMKSIKEMLGLSDPASVKYLGTRIVNDILCDVFQEEKVDMPMPGNTTIIELSFAKRSVIYLSGNTGEEHQVPVKYELYTKGHEGEFQERTQSDIHLIYNLYDFDIKPQFEPTVHTSRCYRGKQTIFFQVNGTYDSITGFKRHKFLKNCHRSIAVAAQVDESRLTDVTPIDNGDSILVQVTLLDHLPVRTYIETGPSLQEAVKNLQQAADNGLVVINDDTSNTQYVSIRNTATTSSPLSDSDCDDSTNKALIIGPAVGSSVAMFLLGAILGTAVLYCFMKKRGAFQTTYKTQTDQKPGAV